MSFLFPGDVSFPVEFLCPHCDEPQRVVGKQVIVCDCPDARRAEQEDRERYRNFHRERQARERKKR